MKASNITALAAIMLGLASLSPCAARSADAAGSATNDYLMWQMPSSGITFPVYVYSNGAQTDYLYGTTQQAFIGPYSATTSGTYALYYQSSSGWYTCTLVLANGAIDSTTTCPGAVINSPVATSNVYTVAFGTDAWPSTATAPVKPRMTDYGTRTITFINKTDYPMIQIGEICTVSANPNNPNCTNNANLFQIANGGSQTFTVDDPVKEGAAFPAGLISYGFSVTAYKNAAGKIISTGGYNSGNPYATKIEFTSLPVATINGAPVPQGATNFDVSAVDGYNISVKAYPQNAAYCTYTVPPENSNVLGAGLYSKTQPLARLSASASVCKASSQLPSATSTPPAWPLAVSDSKGNFQGCMSPCTYATANASTEAPMFCCTGSTYGTAAGCDAPTGSLGANNSTYVQNLAAATQNVYRFAYDDAIGDFACPAETNFVIEFVAK